jgi:hypothetical protein
MVVMRLPRPSVDITDYGGQGHPLKEIFRKGASTKPDVDFLRFIDLSR